MHVKRFTACALAAVLALSPVGGLTAGAAETQDPELILYASFDDETADDASGKGNNGTVTKDEDHGTVEFVEGVNGGKAIYIVNDSAHRKTNPAANYVDFGEDLKVGKDDFSVSLWYKTDPKGVSEGDGSNDDHGGNDVSVFGNKNYASGTNVGLTLGNFSAETPADVRVNFVAQKGTRVEINHVYICDDTWHHLAATFDRDGDMNVYVDGKLYGTKSISTYKDLSLDVAGQNFVLGADGIHTYGTPGATVDELRMYSDVLSASEVEGLYQMDKPVEPPVDWDAETTLNVTFDDGTANDSSSSQTNGTIVGNVQFVDGIKGKAVKISNGEDHRKGNKAESYITFGKQDGVTLGTSDFTLAFWHRSEGHGANDSALISNKNYASGSNVGLAVGNYHTSGGNNDLNDVRVNVSGIKGQRADVQSDQIPANDDAWHYIVASFDRDANMTVYLDGRKAGSASISKFAGTSFDDGEFVLGADGHFTYGADGCILDEVRIIKKALSEEESTTLWLAESLPYKIAQTEAYANIESSGEYSQAGLDAFNAVLESVKSQTGSDIETNAALCTQLSEAWDTLQTQTNEPLLTFDLVSDVHLRDSDSSRASNFIKGLQDIAENHPESDAFVSVGDNTSFGSDNNSRGQYFDLIEDYISFIPNKVVVLGNHDVRKNDSSSSNGFSSNYDVAYKAYMEDNAIYRDDPESDKIYFDKWINGYHFIALNTEEGLKDMISMSDEQLTWLDEKLSEGLDENGNRTAGAADPEKPVFVVVHQALNDTHPRANDYGGFGEQDKQVKEILSRHPQAVVLSGHIHNGFGVATIMDREYGTLVDVPSYNENQFGVTDNGTGYQVDVYADRIHFRARNYMTSTWLPQYDIILATPSLASVTAEASDIASSSDGSGYPADNWNAFTAALSSAENLMGLNNEGMRLEAFEAAVNLDTALDGLAEQPTGEVSKATLEYFLNKAKGYVEDGTVSGLVESVQQMFDDAISKGEAVMADKDATREEVLDAAADLMFAIHALNMKAADKTDLEMAVELAEMIDLSDYVEAGQQEFTDALAAAKDVLNDGSAMQDDADNAWDRLVAAMDALRFKADKSVLEDLISKVEGLDLTGYTTESAEAFRAAFAAANEILADDSLTRESQEKVDSAVSTLQAAYDNLEKTQDDADKEDPDTQDPDNSKAPDTSGDPDGSSDAADKTPSTGTSTDSKDAASAGSKDAPKTGDMTTSLPALMLLVCVSGTGAAACLSRRKK